VCNPCSISELLIETAFIMQEEQLHSNISRFQSVNVKKNRKIPEIHQPLSLEFARPHTLKCDGSSKPMTIHFLKK